MGAIGLGGEADTPHQLLRVLASQQETLFLRIVADEIALRSLQGVQRIGQLPAGPTPNQKQTVGFVTRVQGVRQELCQGGLRRHNLNTGRQERQLPLREYGFALAALQFNRSEFRFLHVIASSWIGTCKVPLSGAP